MLGAKRAHTERLGGKRAHTSSVWKQHEENVLEMESVRGLILPQIRSEEREKG